MPARFATFRVAQLGEPCRLRMGASSRDAQEADDLDMLRSYADSSCGFLREWARLVSNQRPLACEAADSSGCPMGRNPHCQAEVAVVRPSVLRRADYQGLRTITWDSGREGDFLPRCSSSVIPPLDLPPDGELGSQECDRADQSGSGVGGPREGVDARGGPGARWLRSSLCSYRWAAPRRSPTRGRTSSRWRPTTRRSNRCG